MNGAGEEGLQGVAIERSRGAPTAASEDPLPRTRMTEARLGAATERIAPSAAVLVAGFKDSLACTHALLVTLMYSMSE